MATTWCWAARVAKLWRGALYPDKAPTTSISVTAEIAKRKVNGDARSLPAMLPIGELLSETGDNCMTAMLALFDTTNFRWASTRHLSPRAWTAIGALAIPLWATWPAFGWRSLEMPTFECLGIAFFSGWLTLSILERAATRSHAITKEMKSWLPAAAFALANVGNATLHLVATHTIPAAEANLISYLWPVETVALAAAIGIFKLRAVQGIGLVLGFIGVAILMSGQPLALSYVGIVLAFLGGLIWALYCVFRLKWTAPSPHLVSRGLGIAALLSVALHFALEPTTLPSFGGLLSAALVGVVPSALGNWVWDEGFRRGDGQLLAVMAYGTPLCSAVFLTMLDMEIVSWRLLIGGIVIVLAGFLSRNSPT